VAALTKVPNVRRTRGGKHSKCDNCKTVEFPRTWRGFCRRCARYAETLEWTTAWNAEEAATWHGISPDSTQCPFCDGATFVGFMKQVCEKTLSRLRALEGVACGAFPTYGTSLENALFEASELIGGKPRNYYSASQLDNVLKREAKQFVYTWLSDCIWDAKSRKPQFSVKHQATKLAEVAWQRASSSSEEFP
jgi:hypothetical protein